MFQMVNKIIVLVNKNKQNTFFPYKEEIFIHRFN